MFLPVCARVHLYARSPTARPQAQGPRDPPSVFWTLACTRVSGQPESGLVGVCFCTGVAPPPPVLTAGPVLLLSHVPGLAVCPLWAGGLGTPPQGPIHPGWGSRASPSMGRQALTHRPAGRAWAAPACRFWSLLRRSTNRSCDFSEAPGRTTSVGEQEGWGPEPSPWFSALQARTRALPDLQLGVLHLTWRPGLLASSMLPCWAAAHFLSPAPGWTPTSAVVSQGSVPSSLLHWDPRQGRTGPPVLFSPAPPASGLPGWTLLLSPRRPLTKLRLDDGGHPQPQGRPRAWLAAGSQAAVVRAAVGAASGPQLVTKQMFPRQDWLQPTPGWVQTEGEGWRERRP